MARSRKERRQIKRQQRQLRKLEKKKTNDLGDLIDMSQEMFETYIDSKKLNMGQLKLLNSNFNAVYIDLYHKTGALTDKIKADTDQIEKNKDIDVLKRMYVIMQRIENRCVFLCGRIDKLNEEFGRMTEEAN